MYPNHDAHAAAVPVTVVSASIVWCHQCRAWRIHSWGATQQGDDHLVTHWSSEQDMGPFDDFVSVVSALASQLLEHGERPGRPWVRS